MTVLWHPLLYWFILWITQPKKASPSQPKSNQHQLAPTNPQQENPNTGDSEYNGGHRGRGHADKIEVPVAVELEVTPINGMIIRSVQPAVVKDNGTFSIIEGVDKIIHIEVDKDSGMEMT